MSLESSVFRSGVVLRLNAPIEDLRGHGEAAVERLRQALAAGVPFIKDRKRARCYEVRLEGERFYIHVLRNFDKVLLLARWEEERV
jgi:ligand-binding sensor domain-containing protein